MVKWRSLDSIPSSFGGNNYTDVWTFEIKCLIRDTGDPYLATNRVWSATDKILSCFQSDYTIQGTCDCISKMTGNHDPEQLLSVNGVTWLPFSIYVMQKDYRYNSTKNNKNY